MVARMLPARRQHYEATYGVTVRLDAARLDTLEEGRICWRCVTPRPDDP